MNPVVLPYNPEEKEIQGELSIFPLMSFIGTSKIIKKINR
jgi:hypothetical protein